MFIKTAKSNRFLFGVNMVIDVIIEWNYFDFLAFLNNGKISSGKIFCIVFRKFFQWNFYNHIPPINFMVKSSIPSAVVKLHGYLIIYLCFLKKCVVTSKTLLSCKKEELGACKHNPNIIHFWLTTRVSEREVQKKHRR